MKIRLVSIEGRIADPFYNVEKIEKEVERAIYEKIDILFLPSNSIQPVSLEQLRYSDTYQTTYRAALEVFEEIKTKHKDEIKIVLDEVGLKRVFDGNSYYFEVDNAAYPDYLEETEGLPEDYEQEYKDFFNDFDGVFKIVCRGRGTESVCGEIYSNLKMIYFDGKLVASNLKDNGNMIDFDLSKYNIASKTPYLDWIKDQDAFFKRVLERQSYALYRKMQSMDRYKICLGVSGGLDSTVSLLVCYETFKKYNLPLEDILGVTMPGLGTTERTYKNALTLMMELGISIEDIDLKPLLKMHLQNIKQPEGKFDVTFEQTQSRERTQVLLDIANRDNRVMIGTGCMSEFALGWMSYGGDHLSMFAINIGLPKTVVKMYAKWFIKRYGFKHTLAATVKDILEGPVSPELLPIDENGEQHEKTEGIIGDYKVQDFFIYYMSTAQITIKELFKMTCNTFPEYTKEQILIWLQIFVTRFFTRAYKKNCYGDGIQIFKYSASPWYIHIPSDIDNNTWQKEIFEIGDEVLGEK